MESEHPEAFSCYKCGEIHRTCIECKDIDNDDQLSKMWDQQERFMHLLQTERNFPKFPVDIDQKSGQKHVKEIVQDCVSELYEALSELRNSKNHRKTNVEGFNFEHFIEEMCDAQHFLFEVLILAGVSKEKFYETYMKKGEVNVERIKGGY